MIKILDQPESTKGGYETICKKCDTYFAFSECDSYDHKDYDRDGESINKYVDCPNCKYSIPAGTILSPRKNNGFFGMFTSNDLSQLILNNVSVGALRATTSDVEFKKLLIKQLK